MSLEKLPNLRSAPAALDARAAGVMSLLCLLWSLQQISLKAVTPLASPVLMVGVRSVIAALLLGAWMRWQSQGLVRARWKAGALVGALFALEYLLVGAALELTQASHVVVFLYTAPIFAALGLHWRLPAERLGAVHWAGIAVAFCGMALAFLGGGPGGGAGADAAGSRTLLGSALALLAGMSWGATTVVIRCSSLASAPATETLLYQLLGAAGWLLPVAALSGWSGGWSGRAWHFEPVAAVWAHLAFQSLVISFASFLAWFWLLRTYLASRLGVFSFLTPLFGVLLGVGLLGESLEPQFAAGSALVLAGIALVGGQAGIVRLWEARAWRRSAAGVGSGPLARAKCPDPHPRAPPLTPRARTDR